MSEPAATAAITPRQIRQKGPRQLVIVWADGHQSEYDVRDLRLACACAHCINEWTGESLLDPATVPRDVQPVKIEGVGRYAIQIEWSDGHSWGIYTFERLRELGERLGLRSDRP
jgi:ATP-binding protein involved in chromosome partitioning